jgi:hypothetical protein
VWRVTRTAVGFLLALALPVPFLARLDVGSVAATLATAEPSLTTVAAVLPFVGLAAWSEAYRVLLSASGVAAPEP